MSAKLCQIFFAFAQFLIHGIAFNGTAGPLCTVFTPCDHQCRPVISFPDPSGHDTSQTFVTVRKKNYQHPVIDIFFLLRNLFCLFHRMHGQQLPALIQFHDFFCQNCRLRFGFAQQQL